MPEYRPDGKPRTYLYRKTLPQLVPKNDLMKVKGAATNEKYDFWEPAYREFPGLLGLTKRKEITNYILETIVKLKDEQCFKSSDHDDYERCTVWIDHYRITVQYDDFDEELEVDIQKDLTIYLKLYLDPETKKTVITQSFKRN